MLTTFCHGKVFGERTGTGPPQVLALHGWRNDHTDLSKVTEGFNVIALDLAGHGATPPPPTAWGAHQYAMSIESILDEFDTPPVVFAHSFGGRVAVCLAAAYPERIHSLVLTGVPLLRKPSTAKVPLAFRLAKWANKVGVVSDEKMEAERRKRGSEDYRASTGVMRDTFVKLVNEDYREQLAAIQCPVELVWGEKETEAGLWQAKGATEILRNAKLTVVPNGTHWITKTDPQPLRDAIERNLT